MRKFAWRPALDVATAIAMLAASTVVVYFQINPRTAVRSSPALAAPEQTLSLDGAMLEGARTAPTVLIMYSDFQCPFCRRFAQDVLPRIKSEYVITGKLLLAFRHFPLEQIHGKALGLAVAVECAGQQGHFWEMHDRVFGAGPVDEDGVRSTISSLGLDSEVFDRCTRDDRVQAKIKSDAELGRKLGITGTPSFFLGTRTRGDGVKVATAFSGARDFDEFQKLIVPMLHQDSAGMSRQTERNNRDRSQ